MAISTVVYNPPLPRQQELLVKFLNGVRQFCNQIQNINQPGLLPIKEQASRLRKDLNSIHKNVSFLCTVNLGPNVIEFIKQNPPQGNSLVEQYLKSIKENACKLDRKISDFIAYTNNSLQNALLELDLIERGSYETLTFDQLKNLIDNIDKSQFEKPALVGYGPAKELLLRHLLTNVQAA